MGGSPGRWTRKSMRASWRIQSLLEVRASIRADDGMHSSSLQYFKAVAEEGSIRKAAERASVSGSAINRQILKLEAYFGTLLFERRRDGLRLTDEGRLVLSHVQGTLHDFKQLKGAIDSRRGIISGTVTILTLDSLTVHFLPEALSRFSSDNPSVEIRVITGDPIETVRSVAQGSADLGLTFRLHFPVRKGLSVLEDIPCPMHAIMPPDHELVDRRSVTLEECAAYRLIFHDDSGSMRAFLGEDMQAFKHTNRPALTSNTIGFTKQLLRRGAGIAFYTRLGFVEELASGQLVAVPLKGKPLSDLRLALVMSSERVPTVAVKAAAEHLKTSLVRFAAEFGSHAV